MIYDCMGQPASISRLQTKWVDIILFQYVDRVLALGAVKPFFDVYNRQKRIIYLIIFH